jgi:hypothetical protein
MITHVHSYTLMSQMTSTPRWLCAISTTQRECAHCRIFGGPGRWIDFIGKVKPARQAGNGDVAWAWIRYDICWPQESETCITQSCVMAIVAGLPTRNASSNSSRGNAADTHLLDSGCARATGLPVPQRRAACRARADVLIEERFALPSFHPPSASRIGELV